MLCSYLHQFYMALAVLSHPFASKTEDQQCCIPGNSNSPTFLCSPPKMMIPRVVPHPHPSRVSLFGYHRFPRALFPFSSVIQGWTTGSHHAGRQNNQSEGNFSALCNVASGTAVDHHAWSPMLA